MIHLITGYAGYEHITSADDGAFNASFFGHGQYVMDSGSKLSASIIDNNTVRIADGDALMYGRHFRIPFNSWEDLNIKTGTAGTTRTDLIVAEYEKNTNDGTETVTLKVLQGTESYTDGNILEGASFNQMPLYRVRINGVVLEAVEPMFALIPSYKDMADDAVAQFEARIQAMINDIMMKSGGTFSGQVTFTINGGAVTIDSIKATADSAQSTANSASSTASSALSTANNAMPKSGGTFTGAVASTEGLRTNDDLKNSFVRNSAWSPVGTVHLVYIRK